MNYLNRKTLSKLIVVLMILLPTLSIQAQQVEIGHSFKGIASYYHTKFLGRKTANGETFKRGEYTCAHKTLPFGTLLEVENTKTGRWVIVRVNDRGPFSKNRVIDLSIDAAEHLGIISRGVAHIKGRVVGFNGSLELFREGYALDYYNCFLGKDFIPTKIPYLPSENSNITVGI